MKNSPLTNELFQKIQNMSDVKAIFRLKILDCEIVNENVTDIEGIESIINEKEFADQLIEGTMPQKKAEANTMPIIINLASDAYINSQLSLQVGDSILAKIDTGNGIKETCLEVSDTINDPNSINAIYTNEEYLEQITDMNPDVNWYICTDGSDSEQKLLNIVATDNRISLSSKKDTIQQYSDYFYNFTMVGIMLCNKIAELSGIFYIHYKFSVYFLIFYLGFLLIIRLAMTKYQNTIIFKDSIINRIRE